MEKLIQIVIIIVVGYLFQILMQAMNQREIGSIIKICSFVIAASLLIGLIGDCITWLDVHTQPMQDLINKI